MPLVVSSDGPIDLASIRRHLNSPTTVNDGELLDLAASAAEMIEMHLSSNGRGDLVPLDLVRHPGLRLAVLDLIRDIWVWSQSGGGGRTFGQDGGGADVVFSRRSMPPHVRDTLAAFIGKPKASGSFPVTTTDVLRW